MIFQKPTPFPMSIFDNVAYGLKTGRIKKQNRVERPRGESFEMMLLFGMKVKTDCKESALGMSGGQQQRLCIARAVALKPRVFTL